jgi:hypothetical protein
MLFVDFKNFIYVCTVLDTPILGEYDEMSVAIPPASTLLRKNMWVYIYAIQLKIFKCLVLEHSKNAHC